MGHVMKKRVVITGASSGIGKALYDAFRNQANWLFFGRFDDVYGLSRNGPNLWVDVSKLESVGDTCLQAVTSVDLLINCAGIMPFDEGEDYETARRVFDTNFWGTYNMIGNLKDRMTKGSCIINVASVSGMKGEAELPVYAASKAAVISLTKSLALRYAPDIRVNCISPGFYNTNLVPGDAPEEMINTIPMGYEEDPRTLLWAVAMIWNTNYMTGSNIVVDGGLLC